jgi:MerR family transcriptional regulator, light-induced transcriptional regulator
MSSLSHGSSAEPLCWDGVSSSSARPKRARHPVSVISARFGGDDVDHAERTRRSTAERVAKLTRTIETQIIPRLLLANSAGTRRCDEGALASNTQITCTDVTSLAVAVVRDGIESAARMIEGHETRGVQRDAIFLDLLAPAARELGDAWVQDTLTFADVTIGLAGLQQLLRKLSPCFENLEDSQSHGRRIVLVPAAGEQHSFGLSMVDVFFRRAGWDVVCASALNLADVTSLVRRERFDVIGISKSSSALLDSLASDITALRRASCNENVTVMVGGHAFDQHPERAIMVGADVTASDGQQAVWQANLCVKAARMR